MSSKIDQLLSTNPPDPAWPIDLRSNGDALVVVIDEKKYTTMPHEESMEVYSWITMMMQVFKFAGVKAWVDTR